MTKEEFISRCKRQENGCLLWWGLQDGQGYGNIKVNGKYIKAHRYALHLWTGFDLSSPLIVMHDDDHCTSKLCCEYTHLKAGTQQQNIATSNPIKRNYNIEKTHCKYGHEFTKNNTYMYNGKRHCKACRSLTSKKAWVRRKRI